MLGLGRDVRDWLSCIATFPPIPVTSTDSHSRPWEILRSRPISIHSRKLKVIPISSIPFHSHSHWNKKSLKKTYSRARRRMISRRPLSVAWAKSMLCFANVIFYLFFYGRLMLRPRLTEVRETFTRGGPWVWREKLLLAYFPDPPSTTGCAKSDEIWHIFRPRPQTFCSHPQTRQNIVI